MKAAQGRVPVFLDGGVRRGTDVFKALALGASGIFVSTILSVSQLVLHAWPSIWGPAETDLINRPKLNWPVVLNRTT